MNSKQAYEKLMAHVGQTLALSQVAGVLSWDQETMMPSDGAQSRAEQSAALASVIHNRNSDPHIGEWCAAIDVNSLDDVAKANVREAKRAHHRATCVPVKLAEELARAGALGQGIWAKARTAENVTDLSANAVKNGRVKTSGSAVFEA